MTFSKMLRVPAEWLWSAVTRHRVARLADLSVTCHRAERRGESLQPNTHAGAFISPHLTATGRLPKARPSPRTPKRRQQRGSPKRVNNFGARSLLGWLPIHRGAVIASRHERIPPFSAMICFEALISNSTVQAW